MPEKPAELQQFTTEYIEQEDRIKLSGQTSQGFMVMWLPQRLLQRLLPLLFQWLERQHAAAPRVIAFSYMQQTVQARQQAPPQALISWLVTSIDVTTTDGQIRLSFKGDDGQSVQIAFAATTLRQWMEILNDAYIQAQWPLDPWPSWLTEPASLFKGNETTIWH